MKKNQIGRKERAAADLSVSSLATIYGCCGLFDLCGDADLMSLSFEGQVPFLDWIGWERTSVCEIRKNFITYQAPAGTAVGSPTSGIVTDACAPGETIEWGTCEFLLDDFGRIRRVAPTRDITRTSLRLCEAQPRYRLDGTPIVDDREYDMRVTTEVITQDLKGLIVEGNNSNPG